jgi:hypothetical protein
LAAGVNRETDRGGELAGDASFLCIVRILSHTFCDPEISYLQLGQGETTSSSYTAVVLDCWASDDGSQLVNRSGSDSCCLRKTGITASELSAGLGMYVRSSSSS